MTFPVLLLGLHPHLVFDLLAFGIGGWLFRRGLRRSGRADLAGEGKWAVAAGCIVGALVGAKAIVLLEDPARTWAMRGDVVFLLSGKSIVGALLGGLAGVELAKSRAGIAARTGDLFAVPVAVGLAVGRIGCFLSGLTDDAYGIATTLPWGVDFGDGPRHPTQLYEAAFALALAGWLLWRGPSADGGARFRLFMLAYLPFRFAEEFLRVAPRAWLGLTVYQVACLAGLAWYVRGEVHLRRATTTPHT